jgi:hypothetical protein
VLDEYGLRRGDVRILDEPGATRRALGSELARRNPGECAVDGVIRPVPLG